MALYNDKPEIVNRFIDNPNTYCSAYREDNTKKTKYVCNESSYLYNQLKSKNKVLSILNDDYELDNIYGIGTHFSLKNDNKIYTLINNHNGCAGAGTLNETDDKDTFADYIYEKDFPHIEEFGVNELSSIYDTYSYLAGYGYTTWFIMSDKKTIYKSAVDDVEDKINYKPILVHTTDNIISKAGDLAYGELMLLSAGKLIYIGKNSNFIKSTVKDIEYSIHQFDEFDDVEDFWTCSTMIIYKRNNKYFASGYANTSEVNNIIGNNIPPFSKCPFPGVQLVKAPFDEYEKITQIVGNKFGFCVLYNDGRLFQTGLVGFNDISMIDTEVEKIICTNGYNLT